MTLSEFVHAVQDLTCCEDAVLIGKLASANWPDTQDFKPVQARLLARLIEQRGGPDQ